MDGVDGQLGGRVVAVGRWFIGFGECHMWPFGSGHPVAGGGGFGHVLIFFHFSLIVLLK